MGAGDLSLCTCTKLLDDMTMWRDKDCVISGDSPGRDEHVLMMSMTSLPLQPDRK